jgi:hypothetical protein
VHEDLFSFFLCEGLHLLTNHEDLLGCRLFEVFPVVVEVGDAFIVKNIRVIGEPAVIMDTVAAHWVFTRFLKVEHSANVEPVSVTKKGLTV